MDLLDIFDIGIQLVKAIELLHETGHTHNDLKLENIMLMDNNGANDPNSNNVVLIDFGYASKYRDKNGVHIKQHDLGKFKGNILFASISQLEF